jgi:hypothetical protein
MKGGAPPPPLHVTRLLDRVPEGSATACHYSLSTERSYVYWVRAFIRRDQMRHPSEFGRGEDAGIQRFLA